MCLDLLRGLPVLFLALPAQFRLLPAPLAARRASQEHFLTHLVAPRVLLAQSARLPAILEQALVLPAGQVQLPRPRALPSAPLLATSPQKAVSLSILDN